ncbi:hypothetical protein Hanom_Chr02g00134961 [Helianthus anomalus]
MTDQRHRADDGLSAPLFSGDSPHKSPCYTLKNDHRHHRSGATTEPRGKEGGSEEREREREKEHDEGDMRQWCYFSRRIHGMMMVVTTAAASPPSTVVVDRDHGCSVNSARVRGLKRVSSALFRSNSELFGFSVRFYGHISFGSKWFGSRFGLRIRIRSRVRLHFYAGLGLVLVQSFLLLSSKSGHDTTSQGWSASQLSCISGQTRLTRSTPESTQVNRRSTFSQKQSTKLR